jgi:4-amino-4-deoxy-L-arabinose transferase-like glycosyltransferase
MNFRGYVLLGAALLYLIIGNIIWIAQDTRPPYWDSAGHALTAMQVLDAFKDAGLAAVTRVPSITGSYPPAYHVIVAFFYLLFGRTIDAAAWANLPAIALLLIATYGIGKTVLKPFAAATAAVIVVSYPLLLWLSRETLIDYWLTSFVALAVWALLKSKEFSNTRWAIVFGIVCGLGMLTKWTFVFFVALPALWFAMKNLKNAVVAACITAGIGAYWYVPALKVLPNFLRFNVAQSVAEGDPNRFSLEAIIFYVRALEGSQLFLPLFVAFIAGLVLLAFDFNRNWIPVILWIVGGWLGLLLFQNKDPRYTAPLLPAIALVTGVLFQKKEGLAKILIPVLVFQHFLVSFGIPQLPSAITLAKGGTGAITYDWNVYTQSYFTWGPPAREDWKIEHVLETVKKEGRQNLRIGLVPDIPRFDTLAFRFYITRDRLPVFIDRLVTPTEEAMKSNDYILSVEDRKVVEPGAHTAPVLNDIAVYLAQHPQTFEPVEKFSLPNGDVIQLYRVARS